MNTHRSNLQPLVIPDLTYSPCDTGYSSPAESDTVKTPFFNHSDPYIHFNHDKTDLRDTPTSPSPQPFFDSSPRIQHPEGASDYDEDDLLSAETFSSGNHSAPHPRRKLPRPHGPPRTSSDREFFSPRPHIKPLIMRASSHSPRFPPDHDLNPYFVRTYKLEDELGSGGYGFVMTAVHRLTGTEVAVKFITKEKVPDHSWMEDKIFGRLPTEVMLLRVIDHENIVKCLGLYEDSLYYYLIQELHGTPWHKAARAPPSPSISISSLPALSPSVSTDSISQSEPATPPPTSPYFPRQSIPRSAEAVKTKHRPQPPRPSLPLAIPSRPQYSRRSSYDLFECIEQTEHKRLSEAQARYVLMQIVEAAYYLNCHGVSHRDIKDENIVVDQHLKVKLIDFGSAVVEDPGSRPYHTLFFGTTAYASSEILQKKAYQAPPAEVWTIGVLLSFLLTGSSPFPTVKDAIAGNLVPNECFGQLSRGSLELMTMCLDPNPKTRATIAEVRAHAWLQ